MAKKFNKSLRNLIFQRDGSTCRLCEKPFPFMRLQIDHIKPVSAGGEASLENGMVLCDTCNRLKATFYGKDLRRKIIWARERLAFYEKIYYLQTGDKFNG